MKPPKKTKQKGEITPPTSLRLYKFMARDDIYTVIFPVLSSDDNRARTAALKLCQSRKWEYVGRITRNVSAYERARQEKNK